MMGYVPPPPPVFEFAHTVSKNGHSTWNCQLARCEYCGTRPDEMRRKCECCGAPLPQIVISWGST
jgi:hypothetical protein